MAARSHGNHRPLSRRGLWPFSRPEYVRCARPRGQLLYGRRPRRGGCDCLADKCVQGSKKVERGEQTNSSVKVSETADFISVLSTRSDSVKNTGNTREVGSLFTFQRRGSGSSSSSSSCSSSSSAFANGDRSLFIEIVAGYYYLFPIRTSARSGRTRWIALHEGFLTNTSGGVRVPPRNFSLLGG